MKTLHALFLGAIAGGLLLGNPTTIIMEGSITMIDGTPPPKAAALERVCSDSASSQGPLADKQGKWVWKQELDPLASRACFIRATLQGFSSTRFDMSKIDLSTYTHSDILRVPTLVLSPKDSGDLTVIYFPDESQVPGKASKAWKAGVASLKAEQTSQAIQHFQEALAAAPKFADGWNLLGAVYERERQFDKAKDALQHAIDVNPKLLSSYMRMARVCDETSDWDGAARAADTLLKADKHFYPEIYLHQGIARLGLKDLAGAEESVNALIGMDTAHHFPRAEYVLGRILQAKGDVNGAKEHIGQYLKMDPGVADSSQIQVLMDYLGKPGAPAIDTGLERPY